jgi:hypothetical protein
MLPLLLQESAPGIGADPAQLLQEQQDTPCMAVTARAICHSKSVQRGASSVGEASACARISVVRRKAAETSSSGGGSGEGMGAMLLSTRLERLGFKAVHAAVGGPPRPARPRLRAARALRLHNPWRARGIVRQLRPREAAKTD